MNIPAKPPYPAPSGLRAIAAKPARLLAPALMAPLLMVLSLSLAACSPEAATPQEPPLAGADIGGPFSLTSASGETVRWEDFRGEYAVVYFGYAYCPDVCPTDMQRTAQGIREFAEADPQRAARVQPVFITIDPERDTREVVGEFTSAFSDDIIGLTGSPEAIRQAADAFRVYYEKGEETESGGYLVNHTNIVYLFDPAGKPLAMLPTSEGAKAVAAELDKWVQ
jgi:protein SCO1/2